MDHLIQIPQVGRAWEPIPEPWVTLGLLAGLDTRLELGTLVTPVTFRPAGITAKAAATLDALTGGRAFVGLGAGWWEREHAAYGLPFPPPRERLDAVERGDRDDARALGARDQGVRRACPETTCYPRPAHDIPIILGGSGDRTLRDRRAARRRRQRRAPASRSDKALAAVAGHRRRRSTVLDVPPGGRDFADPPARQLDRYGALADQGVDTVFLAIADLAGPDDLERLAPSA